MKNQENEINEPRADQDRPETESVAELQQCIKAMRLQLNRKVYEIENLRFEMREGAIYYRDLIKKNRVEYIEQIENKVRASDYQIADLRKAIKTLRSQNDKLRSDLQVQTAQLEKNHMQTRSKMQNMMLQLRDLMAQRDAAHSHDIVVWEKRIKAEASRHNTIMGQLKKELIMQEKRHQDSIKALQKRHREVQDKKGAEIEKLQRRIQNEHKHSYDEQAMLHNRHQRELQYLKSGLQESRSSYENDRHTTSSKYQKQSRQHLNEKQELERSIQALRERLDQLEQSEKQD